KVSSILQTSDAIAVFAPLRESIFPEFCLLCWIDTFLNPRREVLRREIWELQKEVTKIAFGIDDDGGDTVDGGFFEQRYAETGFPTAGHADADSVRDEIFRVVEK